MKFLLRLLLVLAALVFLLGLAAFDPWVQTQFARAWLDRQPDVHASIESVSAGWTRLEARDLRVQFDRVLLAVPSASVSAPLLSVLTHRPVSVRQLVAKGWTLDLDRPPATARESSAPGGPSISSGLTSLDLGVAREVLAATHELLTSAAFPRGVSIDGVDLEGDVKLPAVSGADPRWLHVVLEGGGLAAGKEGAFTLQVAEFGAAAGPKNTLLVRLDSEARPERIRLERAATSDASQIAFTASIVRPANEENYALELNRAGRRVLQLDTRRSASTMALAGTWRVDARSDDLTTVMPVAPALGLALNGGGPITADAGLARVQVNGALAALADGPSFGRPVLGRLSVATQFALSFERTTARLTQFKGNVTGRGPLGAIALQQPLEFDTDTRRFTVPDPSSDWLRLSLHGLPLALLPALPKPWSLTGGDVQGEVAFRGTGDAMTVRTTSPLQVAGANLARDGQIWGENLDLSLELQGTQMPASWQIEASSIAITHRGHAIASGTGAATKSSSADGLVTLTGKGSINVDAMAAQPLGREIGWLPGRTLMADLTAQLGSSPEVTGKISGVGRVPGRTFEATVSVHADSQGRIIFLVPAKIAFGSRVSDVTAEGTWTGGSAPHFGFTLTGTKVELEHLRPLAAPVAWLLRAPTSHPAGSMAVALNVPGQLPPAQWGVVPGWIKVMVDTLRAQGRDYEDVGGMLTLEPGRLRLEGGHVRMQPYPAAKLDGAITFDPAAALPYRLNANATVAGLDATRLLPPANSTQPPVWVGKYAATVKSTGAADGLPELWRRRSDEFRLTSDAGVIRVLGTQIADAIPRNEPRKNETLARLGAALGEAMKTKREDDIEFVPSAVSRQAESVLNLTYRLREIPYSALAVTAFRTGDGTIHLNDITIEGSRERVTGTGQIAAAESPNLTTHPLRLDLKLAVGQEAAFALADSGLLTGETDARGFTRFAEPIHLEGTLEHIDDTQWREMLVKAAARKP